MVIRIFFLCRAIIMFVVLRLRRWRSGRTSLCLNRSVHVSKPDAAVLCKPGVVLIVVSTTIRYYGYGLCRDRLVCVVLLLGRLCRHRRIACRRRTRHGWRRTKLRWRRSWHDLRGRWRRRYRLSVCGLRRRHRWRRVRLWLCGSWRIFLQLAGQLCRWRRRYRMSICGLQSRGCFAQILHMPLFCLCRYNRRFLARYHRRNALPQARYCIPNNAEPVAGALQGSGIGTKRRLFLLAAALRVRRGNGRACKHGQYEQEGSPHTTYSAGVR